MGDRLAQCCAMHYIYSREEKKMAERNALKPRKCDFCFEEHITDAKGIKAHAIVCEKTLEAQTKPEPAHA